MKIVFIAVSAMLAITTVYCTSTNVNSDKPSGSHNLADATGSENHVANNRPKRMSQFSEEAREAHHNPHDGLSENGGKTLEEESEINSPFADLDKRVSSFVRIGKGHPMNRFIRIGRSPYSYTDQYDDNLYPLDHTGNSFPESFPATQDDDYNSDKRASSFLRIGKSSDPISDEEDSLFESTKLEPQFARTERGPSSFVRIGKAPSSFVRIGRAPSSFVRIGKAPSSFVRIGKAPSSFVRIGKAPSSFVRIGKAPSSFVRIGKAPSSFVRIGKAPSSFVRIGKAPSSFVRIGRAPSSFVRIGKAPSSFVRIGKAPSSFVRIGRPSGSDDELAKRISSFVRIGKSGLDDKRASSFVRIGKSEHSGDDDVDKRISSFVRIGKSELDQDAPSDLDKRVSSFVRIGKSPESSAASSYPSADTAPLLWDGLTNESGTSEDEPIHLANRASSFVRIGKIPSSAFVRIGKNKDLDTDLKEYSRGYRSNQSSFVRIGK